MFKRIITLFLVAVIFSCSNETSNPLETPEGDVDAARMFIRSALDGRWRDAKRLILQDSANIQDLDVAEQNYTSRMNITDQRGYRESQITVHDTRELNDSTTIVIYSNTYKKQRDSLKVVRSGGQWLVDLKYSFPHTNPVVQ